MVEISKHHYDTLVYWANRGYAHDGKAYREKYPQRKDPWYKINKSIFSSPTDTSIKTITKIVLRMYRKDLDRILMSDDIKQVNSKLRLALKVQRAKLMAYTRQFKDLLLKDSHE